MEKLIDDLYPLLSPYLHESDRDADWVKSKDYYEWYYTFGQIFKPKRFLEIGVRYGYSAIAIALATPIEIAYLIDSGIGGVHVYEGGCNLLKASPDTKISCYDASGNDEHELQELFDMVHVDGEHSTDGVYAELTLAAKHLAENGVIIVDDINDKREQANSCEDIRNGVELFLTENQEFHIIEQIDSLTGHYIIKRK